MSDFARHPPLRHLSTPALRLSAAMARPRRIAIGCVVALTALGWAGLALMAAGPMPWLALCSPGSAGGRIAFALVAPMWIAMTLAMMLPTGGPMILTYAEIADTAAQKREPVVSPLVLAFGYVTVWFGFALIAAALQVTLARAGLLTSGGLGKLLGGALFIAAGAYQFSALKHSCLTLCQRPFPFFFSNWTTERGGVFRLGVQQGIACLGCCWAMMLLMFAVGTMNVVWMAALGILMTIEKLATVRRFRELLGFAFALIGAGMMATSLM